MMITRAISAAACDHRLRAAIGDGSTPSARERGGALPSIDMADALLDERRERAVNGAATGSAEVG